MEVLITHLSSSEPLRKASIEIVPTASQTNPRHWSVSWFSMPVTLSYTYTKKHFTPTLNNASNWFSLFKSFNTVDRTPGKRPPWWETIVMRDHPSLKTTCIETLPCICPCQWTSDKDNPPWSDRFWTFRLVLQGSIGTALDEWAANTFGSRAWPGIFLPESTFSADSFTVSVHPHVQPHAVTSVCTLKIPNIGSHTFVWTHENTARTVRNG